MAKGAGESAVVALVEDEPLSRVPAAKALIEAGYRVVAAASGQEGLSLLDDPEVDVAVIDVRLAGRIDGVALAKEARRHRPDLAVIFISALPPGADGAALGTFLQKPFSNDDLVRTVRDTLAARTPRGGSAG
jgi:DNA-binding response OmpR family regulator